MLKIGDKIPHFECLDDSGKMVKSSDYAGKSWIIFFYPKANTPGCAAEVCSLRDSYKDLTNKGYQLLGVSTDPVAAQTKFKAKYSLPFPLLADENKQLVTAFGVWGEKKLYGKIFMGTLRTTFLIDTGGYVSHIIEKVKTADHAAQLLAVL